MLFTFKDFEQHFKESVLRRGMKLFENNKVEPFKHPSGNSYHYLVDGIALNVKRSGDKILSCTCACGSKSYCEHLSALLFYFHSASITESARTKLRPKKGNRFPSSGKLKANYEMGIKNWKSRSAEIKELFKPLTAKNKLDQQHIDQISSQLLYLIKTAKSTRDHFYLSLAIYSEFSTLLNLRLTGDESELKDLVEHCKHYLDSSFQKQLGLPEEEAWLEALLNSVKNNRKLISEAYTFLVPRYLSNSSNVDNVRKVFQALTHRKQKLGNSGKIDKLKVAVLQAEIKLAALYKTTVALALDKRGAEFTLARTELLFCEKKDQRAFKLLEGDHDRIQSEYEIQYPEYLEYALLRARKAHRADLELKYLFRTMVHASYINAAQLKRIDELIKGKKRSKVYSDLIEEIKRYRRTYSFEKLSMMLLHTNRSDELLKELKRFRNKFNLLHTLLIKRLPDYSTELLSLYALHIGDALLEGKYFKVQQGVIDKAKTYIELLPKKEGNFLIDKILDLSGHQAQISKYIRSVLPEE